jgi:hypothetical protein
MLHILQRLYTYVANVCSQSFICFLDICCKCVYLDVAYVPHKFQVFFMCFRHMFRMFQLFRTYIAIVLFGCFKNISEVLYMLQCEPLAAATCYAVHGGEWHKRCEGRAGNRKACESCMDMPRLCMQQALARALQKARASKRGESVRISRQ